MELTPHFSSQPLSLMCEGAWPYCLPSAPPLEPLMTYIPPLFEAWNNDFYPILCLPYPFRVSLIFVFSFDTFSLSYSISGVSRFVGPKSIQVVLFVERWSFFSQDPIVPLLF